MDEDWCLLSDEEEFVSVASPKPVEVIDSEPESEPESESESESKAVFEPEPEASSFKTSLASVAEDSNSSFHDANNEAISLDDIDISTLLRDSPALHATPSSPRSSEDQQYYLHAEVSTVSDNNNSNNNIDGDDDEGISLDDIDISTLLQDSTALREYPSTPRSSAFSLLLLSDEHRSCRMEPTTPSRKRSIKLAFCAPRAKSFPARLRAEMPSRCSPCATIEPPVFTPITVFTRDQSTQVNFDELEIVPAPRASRLESALKRSLDATNALKAKSQDYELISFRLMKTEARLDDSEYRHERDRFKLGRLESGLGLAKKRETDLKAEMQELRQQNEELRCLNTFMTGDLPTADLSATTSIDDLEKLEISLTNKMDAVRAAIRGKYKQAIARAQEEPMCVACMSKAATVVLHPCRHQVLCSACAVCVSSCPIDREDIHDKVLAFGLNAYNE